MQDPLISIVVATRNESRHIAACIQSLLLQTVGDLGLEIIVVDGNSQDTTREIVCGFGDPRVRLLSNPSLTAPHAFNIGLNNARGRYVAILGAHAEYPPDYMATCVREIREHDCVGCSGRVITVAGGNDWQARLIAATLNNPFATSRSSHRHSPAGYAETIPFAVFRKDALALAGGYDEALARNQDNDMNQRLRALGYKLWLTDQTSATYFAHTSIRRFLEYGFRCGRWNTITWKRNPHCMSLYHFAPAALVLLLPLLVPLHLLVGIVAAVRTREPLLPLLALAFHLAYGIGIISGIGVSIERKQIIWAEDLLRDAQL